MGRGYARPGPYAARAVADVIDYTIRRSDRARRVRVTVHPEGEVEVVLPRRAREREAAAAVHELWPWIERRLAEAEHVRAKLAERAGTVPYLGAGLRLVAEPGRTRAHRKGDALHVPAGDARPALERWYRRMAREEVVPRLDDAVDALGVEYVSVRIGNQRTRWGSCSTTGAMSFNWRVLLGARGGFGFVILPRGGHPPPPRYPPRVWGLLRAPGAA